ncbi:alpha/beta fold hydrolase [Vreelandella aquamarina]|uniref:alpha/beta fold hydrolase n=1 Tax=Vreelandella aquamarina TaxID=77097 RepID=UPI00384BCB8A
MAHGFGCNQTMWYRLTPALQSRYTLVLFDYVGSGQSQLSAYDEARYSTLEGYAADINEICTTLDLNQVHFIGHSVSCSIGMLAANNDPERFVSHIMVCPSPCFLNLPPDYYGGFESVDLEELVQLIERDHMGWASYLAPLVMGNANSGSMLGELSDSFCATVPLVARTFAKATFFSDYRDLLPKNQHPALLLQSQIDAIAHETIGHYMQAHMPKSTLRVLPTEGHCIHMTHPELVSHEIITWLEQVT